MKKYLLAFIIALVIAIPVVAAPVINYQPNVFPFEDSTYDLGGEDQAWLTGYFDELCLTADTCETSWPAGGGGGSVDSVNGETGVVVLDTDDIDEGVTNLYYTEARVTANSTVAANTAARHAAVTVTDSSEIDFTLTGQDITAALFSASIDESKLDASVNASLDLAESAAQPGDLHDPVTLAGSLDYLTLAGQVITRNAIDLAADVTGVLSDGNVSDSLTVNWTGLQNYPTGCTNQFVRTIGDTLTCASVASDDITDGTILNADINASAAIAYSKLSLTDAILEADLDSTNAATDNQILSYDNATGGFTWVDAGAGDVVGPASATDNAVPKYDGTTGKLIQNSGFIIDDFGDVSFSGSVIAGTDDVFYANQYGIIASFSTAGISPVSRFSLTAPDTGGSLELGAVSSDTNVSINVIPKGTGEAQVNGQEIIDESMIGRSLTYTAGTVDADAELYTRTKTMILPAAATADSGLIRAVLEEGSATTITEVKCEVTSGTSATIQLEERVDTTPTTAGTDIMTSTLVCDADSQNTTSFANAGIAAGALVSLQIDAQTGDPDLAVHITYSIND